MAPFFLETPPPPILFSPFSDVAAETGTCTARETARGVVAAEEDALLDAPPPGGEEEEREEDDEEDAASTAATEAARAADVGMEMPSGISANGVLRSLQATDCAEGAERWDVWRSVKSKKEDAAGSAAGAGRGRSRDAVFDSPPPEKEEEEEEEEEEEDLSVAGAAE
jgi:hypothetical protein